MDKLSIMICALKEYKKKLNWRKQPNLRENLSEDFVMFKVDYCTYVIGDLEETKLEMTRLRDLLKDELDTIMSYEEENFAPLFAFDDDEDAEMNANYYRDEYIPELQDKIDMYNATLNEEDVEIIADDMCYIEDNVDAKCIVHKNKKYVVIKYD